MIDRRQLTFAMAAPVLAPGGVFAQSGERRPRLGILASSAAALRDPHWVAFFEHLKKLGLVNGQNLTVEIRDADERLERMPALAAELAALKCDAFFCAGTSAALEALSLASRNTPIVIVAVDFDPLTTGDVASLGRPGGRVTGVTAMQASMPAKRLELMREMLPGIQRVAVFTNNQTVDQLSVVQGTARRLGISLQVIDFKRPPFDYPGGFASLQGAKAQALFVLGSGLWVPGRSAIIEQANKARLPSVYHHAGWVEAGGLMAYGFNFPAMWRRGAEMVAQVLRGAKAGELPMEQPTVFELALNLRTAKALGVELPKALMLRADRLVE